MCMKPYYTNYCRWGQFPHMVDGIALCLQLLLCEYPTTLIYVFPLFAISCGNLPGNSSSRNTIFFLLCLGSELAPHKKCTFLYSLQCVILYFCLFAFSLLYDAVMVLVCLPPPPSHHLLYVLYTGTCSFSSSSYHRNWNKLVLQWSSSQNNFQVWSILTC